MEYVGIQTQIQRNNIFSTLQLFLFPVLLTGLIFAITWLVQWYTEMDPTASPYLFSTTMLACGIWFLIAFFFHHRMIMLATGAKPLERVENKRVYNLVENLCISQGMKMPRIYIIDDDSLNAFASGINERTFALTFSKGILEKLDDAELEGVIGHELTHIINRDTRLLMISIIFVGIFSFIAEMVFRGLRFAGDGDSDGKGRWIFILLVLLVSSVAYLLAMLMRFGISRNREFMADAGSAQMTKNPQALASALRKIAGDPLIEAVHNRDVAQLFIEHPQPESRFSIGKLFATHPPIEERIRLLEQFT